MPGPHQKGGALAVPPRSSSRLIADHQLDVEEQACERYAAFIRSARNVASQFEAIGLAFPEPLKRMFRNNRCVELPANPCIVLGED